MSLFSSEKSKSKETHEDISWKQLQENFNKIVVLASQKRGYEFEKFLIEFFNVFGLNPNSPFKIIGEQIDGSFEMEGNVYLVEAKWQDSLTQEKDLLILRGN